MNSLRPFTIGLLLYSVDSAAQGVRISNDLLDPHDFAILDIDVSGLTEKKGVLIPRMTETDMEGISTPATGLLVYQTDADAGFHYYDGSQWRPLNAGAAGDDLGNHVATQNVRMNGNWLSADGSDHGIMVTSDGKVGFGIEDPNADLHIEGEVQMNELAGSGTRMVVADADGVLSTQAIPTGSGVSGSTLYLDVTSDVERECQWRGVHSCNLRQ